MPRAPQNEIDDSYLKILLPDFSGGLDQYIGAISLPLNKSPDMLNVVPFPGRLKYRGGYSQYCPMTATADQAGAFYDNAGIKHFPTWAGGNLVDTVSGAVVNVELGVYTAGEKVGFVILNGVLYWSTKTVPLRFWNPAAGTSGAVVQTGVSPPPASPYLFLYTNAIVALGVKYGAAAYQPTVMGWSHVNDPTNWDASDSQAVGERNGSALEFGIVLGIANTGVPPTRTFIVARSDRGILSYTGALNSLQENALNCPVGCRDGASAQFIPGADGFGDVIFLGTDNQFWKTNGINCVVASLNISPLLTSQAGYALSVNPDARFWSGYNERYVYYFCNIGDFQFVYKWDMDCWTLFSGWTNGPVFQSTDNSGVPALYCASNDSLRKGVNQLGLAGQADGNTPPSIYYSSPYIHAGDPELLKLWHWLALFAYNTGTIYKITARGFSRGNDGTFQQTTEINLQSAPGGATGNVFILDVSILDGPGVLVPPGSLAAASAPVMMHGRLVSEFVPEEDSMLRGITGLFEELKATAVQVTVAYNGGLLDFDILGLQLRYMNRGYRREGGNEYDAEMGVPNTFDAFCIPDDLTPSDPI